MIDEEFNNRMMQANEIYYNTCIVKKEVNKNHYIENILVSVPPNFILKC